MFLYKSQISKSGLVLRSFTWLAANLLVIFTVGVSTCWFSVADCVHSSYSIISKDTTGQWWYCTHVLGQQLISSGWLVGDLPLEDSEIINEWTWWWCSTQTESKQYQILLFWCQFSATAVNGYLIMVIIEYYLSSNDQVKYVFLSTQFHTFEFFTIKSQINIRKSQVATNRSQVVTQVLAGIFTPEKLLGQPQ